MFQFTTRFCLPMRNHWACDSLLNRASKAKLMITAGNKWAKAVFFLALECLYSVPFVT